jgi:hypothetical protein
VSSSPHREEDAKRYHLIFKAVGCQEVCQNVSSSPQRDENVKWGDSLTDLWLDTSTKLKMVNYWWYRRVSVCYHSGGSMKLNACILILAHMVYL